MKLSQLTITELQAAYQLAVMITQHQDHPDLPGLNRYSKLLTKITEEFNKRAEKLIDEKPEFKIEVDQWFEDVVAIWEWYNDLRVSFDIGQKLKLTAKRKQTIRARLKDHSADEIKRAFSFKFFQWSKDEDSRKYLDLAYTDTLLRPSKLDKYVDQAKNTSNWNMVEEQENNKSWTDQ